MQQTREVLWNINHAWVMYALLVPTVIVAAYGLYLRIRRWRRGQPAQRFDRPLKRLGRVVRMALLQLPIWKQPLSGAFHALLFWGFVTLMIATTVVMVHHDFHIPIMQGRFYLYFQSLFVDIINVVSSSKIFRYVSSVLTKP